MTRGFGLLEVVIGASIILVCLFALMNVLATTTQLNERNLRAVRAASLLTEGVEAVKFLRASGWAAQLAPLTAGTPYALGWSAGTSRWEATTTVALIDNLFARRFWLETAYRDGNQDLAASGAADPDTRRLVVTVSWLERGATTTATTTTYVTNLFRN